jgi:ABC-type proline/glycine betaine transport system ATPase subunit
LPYDEIHYKNVLNACALISDIAMFDDGDNTIIGDRGVNLSGGQRARIGLARACYATAELYLFDDPLSAVDPHVGNVLFNKAICSHLSSCTRILITHQVQYLSYSGISRIVVLANGAIKSMGNYEELLNGGYLDWLKSQKHDEVIEEDINVRETVDGFNINQDMTIADNESVQDKNSGDNLNEENGDTENSNYATPLSCEYNIELSHVNTNNQTDEEEDNANTINSTSNFDGKLRERLRTNSSIEEHNNKVIEIIKKKSTANQIKPKTGITVKEDIESGDVKLSTYMQYIKYLGGYCMLLYLTVVMGIGQVYI